MSGSRAATRRATAQAPSARVSACYVAAPTHLGNRLAQGDHGERGPWTLSADLGESISNGGPDHDGRQHRRREQALVMHARPAAMLLLSLGWLERLSVPAARVIRDADRPPGLKLARALSRAARRPRPRGMAQRQPSRGTTLRFSPKREPRWVAEHSFQAVLCRLTIEHPRQAAELTHSRRLHRSAHEELALAVLGCSCLCVGCLRYSWPRASS